MLQMSVDTRAIERRLNGLAASQLPFATALGINDVAGQIVEAERPALSRDLDRPTPFTARGLTVSRASKRRLVGVVGFKPIQASYLARQATGGKRLPNRKAIPVPVRGRRNKFGNLPRNYIKRQLLRPDVFAGEVNGVAGVWQRPHRSKRRGGGTGTAGAQKGLKLLVAYKVSASYRPRLKFVARAEVVARREIGPAIARRLAQAVKTAR